MAVKDFGAAVLGGAVEVLAADTRNKPDVAGGIAREWYDNGVDAITDLPVTPIAAAVQQAAREKARTVMIAAATANKFTAKTCAAFSTMWIDDNHALVSATTRAAGTRPGQNWFFIAVDYTFGRTLTAEAAGLIAAAGGKVVGSALFPLGSTDFSSQVAAAQSSGADVIGLVAVSNDQVNLIKQVAEFGLGAGGRPTLAAFNVYVTDIKALGLPLAKGLTFGAGFYWDANDGTRAFSARFHAERRAMPTKTHAAVYTACLHFLRSMQAAGTRDALAVNRAMRSLPVDRFGQPVTVRADGRVLYDLGLYRVKEPAQSTGGWDLYEQSAPSRPRMRSCRWPQGARRPPDAGGGGLKAPSPQPRRRVGGRPPDCGQAGRAWCRSRRAGCPARAPRQRRHAQPSRTTSPAQA